MKLSQVLMVILLFCLHSLDLQAQMYEWTDEKGVKHYSNVAPSESAAEIDKKQESKENGLPDKTGRNTVPRKTFKKKSPSEKTAPDPEIGPPPDDEQNSNEDFSANLNLKLEQFPKSQEDLVNEEKVRLQKIRKYSQENSIKDKDVIQREKNRLLKAIKDLEEAPLEKFGSSDIKRRQIGYYRYRLQELLTSPDTYFGGALD